MGVQPEQVAGRTLTPTRAAEFSAVNHAFRGPDGRAIPVLRNIDLHVDMGEILAIVGPSGCGKTTLLNLLTALVHPQEGSVSVLGAAPISGNRSIGYMFARDALLPWRTAQQNVELPLELDGVPKKERTSRARDALSDVGLSGFEDAYRAQLSQGMRQRAALARTLALEPQVLLMDEPFGALDAQTRLTVQERFLHLCQQRSVTVLLITHDLAEAVAMADRVVVMTRRPGEIKAEFSIELPTPRSVVGLQDDTEYHRYYENVWGSLRDEFTDQTGDHQ